MSPRTSTTGRTPSTAVTWDMTPETGQCRSTTLPVSHSRYGRMTGLMDSQESRKAATSALSLSRSCAELSLQVTHVTYTLSDATSTSQGKLTNRIVSLSLDQPAPIMLSTHIYWNLGAFMSPTILNDTLWMPNADRIISIDSLEVPTGGLQSVKYPFASPGLPLNFTGPKQIYEGALYAQQCGDGCTGIDNAFIIDRPPYSGVNSIEATQLYWSSPDTGLTMKVKTNQQSFQIYSCVGQDGTIKSHASQGSPPIEKYGCLVIEPQQWASLPCPECSVLPANARFLQRLMASWRYSGANSINRYSVQHLVLHSTGQSTTLPPTGALEPGRVDPSDPIVNLKEPPVAHAESCRT